MGLVGKKIIALAIVILLYIAIFWEGRIRSANNRIKDEELQQAGSKEYIPPKQTPDSGLQEGEIGIPKTIAPESVGYPTTSRPGSGKNFAPDQEDNAPRPVAWKPEKKEPDPVTSSPDGKGAKPSKEEEHPSAVHLTKREPQVMGSKASGDLETATLTPAASQKKVGKYHVKKGDSLWNIAEQLYKTKDRQEVNRWVSKIVEMNKWLRENPDKLVPGVVLDIPYAALLIEQTETFGSAPEQSAPVIVSAADKAAILKKSADLLLAFHDVCYGETLYSLAEKYYHDRSKWLLIYEANSRINPNRLECGMRLKIPLAQGDN